MTPGQRRTRLPHFHRDGLIQSITIRLADAVPAEAIAGWRSELAARAEQRTDPGRVAQLRCWIERYSDAGHGACWLADRQVGSTVAEEILQDEGITHETLAWCVMPNHVHALVRPRKGVKLPELVRSWKSRSSIAANRLMGRTGPFWMRGYFDRFIRSDEHLINAIRYIEGNPVTAGLVRRPEAWALSSAAVRRNG